MHDIDLDSLYKQYFGIVNNYLFCLTHNKDLADDLTQETFYKAMRDIDTYKGKSKISVWLCQIAKNLCYDNYRQTKKIKYFNDGLIGLESPENVENQVINNLEKVSLYKKIDCLDDKTKEVIDLRISGDLSFKEIGVKLNKSENWARITFYRGKNKLKECEMILMQMINLIMQLLEVSNKNWVL